MHKCVYCDCMIIQHDWYSITLRDRATTNANKLYFCGTLCMRNWSQMMSFITKYIKTKRVTDQTSYTSILRSSRADVPLFHFL